MALAAMRIAGDVAPEQAFQSVERLRDAMVSMGRFESLDDTDSVAALVRLVVTTASIGPGATVVITEVEPDPQDPTKARDIHIAATISVDGGVNVDRLLGATPDPKHGGIVFISQKDSVVELCFQKIEFKGDFLQPDTLDAFASHAGEVAGGMELMLDLENLRRAWPQSLADGPARRVIAVTGLANARKIHVHVPEFGCRAAGVFEPGVAGRGRLDANRASAGRARAKSACGGPRCSTRGCGRMPLLSKTSRARRLPGSSRIG